MAHLRVFQSCLKPSLDFKLPKYKDTHIRFTFLLENIPSSVQWRVLWLVYSVSVRKVSLKGQHEHIIVPIPWIMMQRPLLKGPPASGIIPTCPSPCIRFWQSGVLTWLSWVVLAGVSREVASKMSAGATVPCRLDRLRDVPSLLLAPHGASRWCWLLAGGLSSASCWLLHGQLRESHCRNVILF